MSNTSIQLKKSGVTGNTPSVLEYGELAINYADGKLFYKNSSDEITFITSDTSTNTFATINSNNSLILATSPNDILSFNSSNNVTITTDTGGKSITIGTADSGATPGTYGSSGFVPVVVVDKLGRITEITEVPSGTSATPIVFLSMEKKTYTASAAQTTFAITYTAPLVSLSINGADIDPSEYTATDGVTVVLTNSTIAGDIVNITGYKENNSLGSQLIVSNTTQSVSTSSGALIVSGGAGISGNLHVSSIHVTGSGNGIMFPDGSMQTTAASGSGTDQFARNTANTANVVAQASFDYANTIISGTGPQGPQGNIGAQGPQGSTGPQGDTGFDGVQGNQGFQGVIGAQGSQGAQGTQGFQGVIGAQGAQGFQGVVGVQGAVGAQGSQGAQGFQGFQGVIGAQGTQGFQGVVGAQGVQGGVGAQGAIGPQGLYYTDAFDKANSANVLAQSAFDTANTKFNTSGGYITGFANVSSNVSVGTSIDFNPNPTGEAAQQEGRIFYDKYSKAFGGYNDTERYVHFGKDLGIRVFNNTGSTINAASPVYINGASTANGFPIIALADASSAASAEVIGLTQTNIANGTYGMVISAGAIEYLDTTLYTAGQEIYLSTTPGQFTTTIPAPPNVPLSLGYITSSSLTHGELLIKLHLMEGLNKTTGSILFARNNLIDEDPETLHWDFANNSLGIGTNAPAANLHVIGSGLFSGNVSITGNLLVTNAQSITTSELTVGGNTIILNSSTTGSPTSNATIIVNRGSSSNSYIRWDEVFHGWTIYDGAGTEGYVLDSEKTIINWPAYTSASTYQKSKYPIGADLSNSINELAKTANTIAYSGQAQSLIATNLAQAAYNSGNTTLTYAQAGYGAGNTNLIYAQAAFGLANTHTTAITVIQGVDTTQNTNITNLTTYAQAGYGLANATTTYAQAGYGVANTATSNITIIQGVDTTQNTNITNLTTYAQAGFGLANNTTTYSQAGFGVANTARDNITIIQGVDTTQNTNISILQGGLNTANANIVIIQGVDTTQNTHIGLAWTKANNAVQTGWPVISANGFAHTASSNNDTLVIQAATANGINVLSPSQSHIDLGLRNSGVTSGTYGDSTHVVQVSIDAFGRITSAANVAVSGGSGSGLTSKQVYVQNMFYN